jgi:hypothetical protein
MKAGGQGAFPAFSCPSFLHTPHLIVQSRTALKAVTGRNFASDGLEFVGFVSLGEERSPCPAFPAFLWYSSL